MYYFSELSTEAQQTAIDAEREERESKGWEDFWIDERGEAFKKLAVLFDLDIPFRLDEYSDIVNRNLMPCKHGLSGSRLMAWVHNNLYSILFERKKYKINGKTRMSRIMFVETSCPLTGISYDESALKPFREYLKKPDNRDLQDLLFDCFHELDRDRESEERYYFSDEGIKEDIESGCMGFDDAMFYQDGTRAEQAIINQVKEAYQEIAL